MQNQIKICTTVSNQIKKIKLKKVAFQKISFSKNLEYKQLENAHSYVKDTKNKKN